MNNYWQRQKEFDNEMMNIKKPRLMRTHFSQGSMHEDIGTLAGKLNNIMNQLSDLVGEFNNMRYAIRILRHDSIGTGYDNKANDEFTNFEDEMKEFGGIIEDHMYKIRTIKNSFDEFSDPTHEIWNDEEEEGQIEPTNNPENPELNESIEKIKSTFKRFL
jgi:hypothetical protein